RHRHRQHLLVDDSVRCAPAGAARRVDGNPVARLRADRSGRVLRPPRLDPRLRTGLMLVAANPLIEVRLGLMVWTIVCFGLTFLVLKRFAFGYIQKAIDERRERIRRSLEEADKARSEARRLLEEHRALIGQA